VTANVVEAEWPTDPSGTELWLLQKILAARNKAEYFGCLVAIDKYSELPIRAFEPRQGLYRVARPVVRLGGV